MKEELSLIERNNLVYDPIDYSAAWKKYKEENKKKPKNHKINTEAEYRRIVKACFKEVAYYWTNSTGGIYMKGLGYFTFLRPLKKFSTLSNPKYFNTIFTTNGYYYLTTHVTNLRPTDSFGGFKIRRAFGTIKNEAHANIMQGRRYTINNQLIKDYLRKRTYI